MLYFSVERIVLATDSSGCSLNLSNSIRTSPSVQSFQYATFESRLKMVLDLVTDLHKEFQSFKSESGRANDQPSDVQTRDSELQEANARILQLQTEKAEIRKENAYLKVQVVSDGVNHTTFL